MFGHRYIKDRQMCSTVTKWLNTPQAWFTALVLTIVGGWTSSATSLFGEKITQTWWKKIEWVYIHKSIPNPWWIQHTHAVPTVTHAGSFKLKLAADPVPLKCLQPHNNYTWLWYVHAVTKIFYQSVIALFASLACGQAMDGIYTKHGCP